MVWWTKNKPSSNTSDIDEQKFQPNGDFNDVKLIKGHYKILTRVKPNPLVA